MQASNRSLLDWYRRVQYGQIKLPRFQRFEAWDRGKISSLLETVLHDLPLGITLILEVGDEEKFISRRLETAPEGESKVHEHLLDGQQRLTALWRILQNNYNSETYFVYLKEFDNYEGDSEREDLTVHWQGRYTKNGQRYPLWCDDPAECLRRGMVPTELLRPEDIQDEIDTWIEVAMAPSRPTEDFEALEQFHETKKRVNHRILELRSTVKSFNLPYLALPPQTDKTVALNVFINMNTNTKPLSTYDIIVAEVESVMGQSLHDLEMSLDELHPEVGRYSALSDVILTTSALLQGYLPNQRGAWDMDKRALVNNWEPMEAGLNRMADFLRREGIFDKQRLPTNAVLAPIAALYARDVAEHGDKRGKDELLLRRYLWHAFFSDRYENAAASRAFADFNSLKRLMRGETKANGETYTESDIPIFAEHSLAEVEELMTADWPKRTTIRGRGILAVVNRLGAQDFSTGEPLHPQNIGDRHYHHIFPDALLKEAEIKSYLALNCALISDRTNIAIGHKDPLKYLQDRYEWASEDVVRERLQSHLIPVEELANGGYEGLSETEKTEKLRADFETFIRRRAELVHRAVQLLSEGRQLSASVVYEAQDAQEVNR